MNDKKKKERLTSLVSNVLPFVSDVSVERLADKSFILQLREQGTGFSFPATFISDGTMNITALIVALFLERERATALTILEEPERNVHPQLIGKIVDMIKIASEQSQLLITTHSPEVIKHVDVQSVFLVHRDRDGSSVLSQISHSEQVMRMLQEEIGVDELFVRSLLEQVL